MPTTLRFATINEICADVQTAIQALSLFESVVRFHGSKFETIRSAIENTIRCPACIIQPGIGNFDEQSVANGRTVGLVLYLVTEEQVLTEDAEYASLATLAEAVMDAFLPAAATAADDRAINDVLYRPLGWSAIDFDSQYDVYRVNLLAWDCRRNRA